jgi:predicted nucleic acid-binding protein
MTFIDTNILLYAFGADDGTGRSEVARRILERSDLAFSIQVFQEFHVQAISPYPVEPLSPVESREVIETLGAAFPVQVNYLAVFREALAIQDRYQTSFWDANILAAARALGC